MKYKTGDLPNHPTRTNPLPALTAGVLNQGLNNYVPETNATIFQNVISVSANGANTGVMFYQTSKFTVLQDAYVIDLIDKPENIDAEYLYLVGALQKSIRFNFDWTNKAGWERIKTEIVTLPTHINGEIAFDFMAEYIKFLEAKRIKELETYLTKTGLNDFVLTDTEKQLVADFRNEGTVRWGTFKIGQLFDHVVQGRRLKKDDQVVGDLPFVMSGTTNTGIANYISNDVRIFPANSLTVDIFGSVFYRNYEYGMGDDTGAYWNNDNRISKYGLLFTGTAIEKSLVGQYDYGNKLRSSKSLDKEIQLPIKSDSTPDFDKMSAYIRVIEKMLIKGVIEWKDKQVAMTADIVNDNSYS